MIGVGAGERAVGIHRDAFERSRVDEPAQHRVADAGMIGQFADRALAAFKCGERFLALRGEARRHRPGRPVFGELARAIEGGRRRQDHPQHRRERAEVIIGGPFAQTAQRRGDRRNVDNAGKRAQPVVADLLRGQPIRFPRDAEQLPGAERRDHDRAGLDAYAVRHAIIERPERGIHRDDAGAILSHCGRNAAIATSLRVHARAGTSVREPGSTIKRRLLIRAA